MIKVLIADDQQLIQESLKVVLDSREHIHVTGIAANGQEVLQCIRQQKPDVILMDIRMPKMDGVQCTELVKQYDPAIKIIILTTFDDDEYVYSALKYGASGYLLKGVSMDELVRALETVHGGGAMINPDIATKVVRLFSQIAKSDFTIRVPSKGRDELTRTEHGIISHVATGATNKEIADAMNLSEGTVRNYLSAILNKLDLRDRTQLAIWAIQSQRVMGQTIS